MNLSGQEHKNVILHLDIDYFYAQVEELYKPELKEKPIGVYQKTIIVTSNYVAREYGIKKCMLINEAIKLCPNLILLNGENLEKYREISERITKFLQNTYKVDVEKLGFDENYIDITNLVEEQMKSNEIYNKVDDDDIDMFEDDFSITPQCHNSGEALNKQKKRNSVDNYKNKNVKRIKVDNCNELEEEMKDDNVTRNKKKQNSKFEVIGNIYKNIKGKCSCGCIIKLIIGTHIADDIRKAVHNEFNLTLSGGISYNKLLSKLVSSLHKPNAQTVLFPNATHDLMMNINLRQIPGIGSKMFEKLNSINIKSIEDLQNINKDVLIENFDLNTSDWLINVANGNDNSKIKNYKKAISIGVEDRYHKSINTLNEFKKQCIILLERLLILINKDGRLPKLLKINLRFNYFKFEFKLDSKQCQINPKIFTNLNQNIIIDYLIENIVKMYKALCQKKKSKIITYISISLSNFIEISQNSISNFFEKSISSNISTQTSISSNISTQTSISSNIPTQTSTSSKISTETSMSSNISTQTSISSNISTQTSSISNIPTSNSIPTSTETSNSKKVSTECTQNESDMFSNSSSSDSFNESTNSIISSNLNLEHFENEASVVDELSDISKESDDVNELNSSVRSFDCSNEMFKNPSLQPSCSLTTNETSKSSSSPSTISNTTTFNNDLLDYKNIDKDMLSELPDDIRLEIENEMKSAARNHKEKSKNSIQTTSHGSTSDSNNKNKKDDQNQTKKKRIRQLSMLNFVTKQ